MLPHKKIWPDLKAAIQEQMKDFKTSNPLERDADMGPVINRGAYDSITGFIKRGHDDSSVSMVWGGEFSDDKGLYIRSLLYPGSKR